MTDLISRQAAIEALGEEPEVWEDPWTTDSDYSKGQRSQWKSDKLAIQAVPSAQKRGKWVEDEYWDYKCSACGKGIDDEIYLFMPYCPNCGARMERSEDG